MPPNTLKFLIFAAKLYVWDYIEGCGTSLKRSFD